MEQSGRHGEPGPCPQAPRRWSRADGNNAASAGALAAHLCGDRPVDDADPPAVGLERTPRDPIVANQHQRGARVVIGGHRPRVPQVPLE